ncbi:MAG TPA: class I SAM-dependent methyltransferase [Bryobacteraceae bacterium]|nr:class I SAM-dependent methyltransferase [Bryobacteraceae bacterium]
MNSPDPAPVIDLIEAFRRSKTMFAAVALGVFDRLERGPADVSVLAKELGAETGALERLLDACAGLGFLRKQDGRYANEPVAAAYLCRSSERALTGYILYSNDVLFPMWRHLEDAVREGSHRWKQAFGMDGPIFDHFFRTGEAMRTFLLGMHGFGVLSSPKVVAAFDLSRFHLLADLGGATGHLAIAACERYPNLRAAVFDLPRVIEVAREQVERSSAAPRIELIAGDFFRDNLPPADLFAVSRILHDWSEEKIRALLGKIYERLPRGGGLLIAEKLLAEDKTGPTPAHMQSLNMLICTEGRERTAGEYRALLEAAGFKSVQACRTGAPLDAVLAVKS